MTLSFFILCYYLSCLATVDVNDVVSDIENSKPLQSSGGLRWELRGGKILAVLKPSQGELLQDERVSLFLHVFLVTNRLLMPLTL